MAVNWQTIEIPFGGGLNTKTNPRRLQAPQLEDLQNLVFTDAPGYKARYGSSAVTNAIDGGGSFSKIVSLGTRNDELFVLDDTNIYSYSTLNAPSQPWRDLNSSAPFAAPKVSQRINFSGRGNQSFCSTGEIGSLRVSAWLENTESGTTYLYVSIEDKTTGWKVWSELGDQTTHTKPRVITGSSEIYLFYHDPSATALKYVKVSEAGTGSATTVKSDMNAVGYWDAVVDPTDADKFLIVYRATTNVNGFVFDASTDSIGSTQTLESTATRRDITALSVSANQSSCFVFACDETTPSLWIRSVDLDLATNNTLENSASTQAGATAIAASASATSAYDGGDVAYFWSVENSTDSWKDITYSSTDGTLGTGTNIDHSTLASDGFWYNGVGYVLIAHDSEVGSSGSPTRNQSKNGIQKTNFLVDSGLRVCGRFNAGTAFGRYAASHLSNPFQVSTDVWDIPTLYLQKIVAAPDPDDEGFSHRQNNIVTLDFNSSVRYQSVEVGNCAYIAAGNVLWEYDGVGLYEAQTLLFPENVEATDDTGGSMAAGTYNYRVYWEYTTASGERYLSTTAEVISVVCDATSAAANEVNFTIPTNTHTRRVANLEVLNAVVFRSEVDADVASGAPFYRVSSANPNTAGSANGFIPNSASATVTFTDQLSDTDLITRELDYLNTGELDNVAVPDVEYIALAKGRVWAVGGLNKNLCYYSKLRQQGKALAFNETLTIQLPDDSDPGGITTVAELNHFVVFFKSESIYVVSGDGPDNLGRGFFNDPQRVTSDVGCSEPRSVVAYDGGLLFKSDKGIYRLGQNLQVDYIGAPVEAYNSQDITAATLVNDQNQIRFLTSSGRMLVYDYYVDQWTTFTGWTGISAVNWRNGDVYCWAESDGTVHQEDTSTYGDDGTPVDWSFTTAPINLQGLGGYMRMKRLFFDGDYSTAVRFEVTPYYNGASTGTEAAVTSASLTTNDPFRVVFNMPRQKFSDVKFKVTADKNANGTMEGVTIQSMRVRVAHKPGLDRLPAGNKFGS